MDLIEFELAKTSREAQMEVTVSPINFLLADECKRPTRDLYLNHGFLQLKGVKVTMCGLYSGVGKCGLYSDIGICGLCSGIGMCELFSGIGMCGLYGGIYMCGLYGGVYMWTI